MAMENISINQENKVKITCAKEKRTVEIGHQAIEAGLLNHLPGSCLALFLYLVSGTNSQGYIYTNPALISSYVPYNRQQVKDGFDYLEQEGIIQIEECRQGDYTHKVSLDLTGLLDEAKQQNSVPENVSRAKKKVLTGKDPQRQQLVAALKTYIPARGRKIDVEKWIDDFEPKVIKELIRRVDKWFDNNKQQPPENRFYYLMGILDDWYSKEIFTYKRLRYFDQLYRETQELALTYGIQKWYNLNLTQMNTFKSWISGEKGLNLSVAKLAIQEAIRRKKDGQPSLKYIEDNFIKPWQKAGIKNCKQAKNMLTNKNRKDTTEEDQNNRQKNEWENFSWDFNLFVEG